MSADLETRELTDGDDGVLVALAQWAAQAPADQECARLLARCGATGVASYEVNFGIFLDGAFVGGIATSGEHFNLMWLHWDHRGKRIASRAARVVIARQLAKYGTAIINSPNERMCRALMKIVTTARASRVSCSGALASLKLVPGDLR